MRCWRTAQMRSWTILAWCGSPSHNNSSLLSERHTSCKVKHWRSRSSQSLSISDLWQASFGRGSNRAAIWQITGHRRASKASMCSMGVFRSWAVIKMPTLQALRSRRQRTTTIWKAIQTMTTASRSSTMRLRNWASWSSKIWRRGSHPKMHWKKISRILSSQAWRLQEMAIWESVSGRTWFRWRTAWRITKLSFSSSFSRSICYSNSSKNKRKWNKKGYWISIIPHNKVRAPTKRRISLWASMEFIRECDWTSRQRSARRIGGHRLEGGRSMVAPRTCWWPARLSILRIEAASLPPGDLSKCRHSRSQWICSQDEAEDIYP